MALKGGFNVLLKAVDAMFDLNETSSTTTPYRRPSLRLVQGSQASAGQGTAPTDPSLFAGIIDFDRSSWASAAPKPEQTDPSVSYGVFDVSSFRGRSQASAAPKSEPKASPEFDRVLNAFRNGPSHNIADAYRSGTPRKKSRGLWPRFSASSVASDISSKLLKTVDDLGNNAKRAWDRIALSASTTFRDVSSKVEEKIQDVENAAISLAGHVARTMKTSARQRSRMDRGHAAYAYSTTTVAAMQSVNFTKEMDALLQRRNPDAAVVSNIKLELYRTRKNRSRDTTQEQRQMTLTRAS